MPPKLNVSALSKGAGGAGADAAAAAASKAAAKQAAGAAAGAASKAAAKQAAEAAAQAAAKQASKQAAIQTAKTVAKGAAGVAIVGAGVYTVAQSSSDADKSNKTPRGITKIEPSDGKSKQVLKVYFAPAIRILKSDIITISGSKTVPSIDGPQTVKSVVSDGEIVIDFGKDITTMTEGGSIKVQTSASEQMKDSVVEAGTDVGEAVGGAAGGAAGGATKGIFDGLTDSLGFDPKNILWWGLGIMGVLLVIFLIFKFI